ncbi:MAG: hypothetical protein J6S21_00320 [Victivallales bacterium]|nr:hypothetical protein [Victivallales bacterium]
MSKNTSFVISVMEQDRVGIIADVSGIIKKLGGNLADVSQTVMRGYFTMILLADFTREVTAGEIRDAFAENPSLAAAAIGILPFDKETNPAAPVPALDALPPENRYVLTASGPDRPGMVSTIAAYLQERNINIVDLTTCVNNGEYTMIWLIDIPADLPVAKLKNSLDVNLAELNMKIAVRNQAIFTVTNEI